MRLTIIIIFVIALSICCCIEGRFTILKRKPTASPASDSDISPLRASSGSKTTEKCKCKPSRADKSLCASNGVDYPSQCAFECALKKVPRLKVVRKGSCEGLTRKDFYKATGSSS